MSDVILKAQDLKKEYESPAGRFSVLKGVQFTHKKGEMNFIVGKSGTGKSTLLHLFGGLDHPTGGKIFFEDQIITQMKEKKLAKLRNIRFGFVFQFYHLLPELTVYENVLLPTLIAGKPNPKWAREILKRMKLLNRRDYYPTELSGGEKQRVAIGRALVNKPSIVFCDEPTGNLDEETAGLVFSVIRELNQQEGQSFLVVTHDETLAWRYPKHVYRLHDGLLTQQDRAPSPSGEKHTDEDSNQNRKSLF